MKLFALLATISSASALKTRGSIKATQALTVPRGGGVDVEQIASEAARKSTFAVRYKNFALNHG